MPAYGGKISPSHSDPGATSHSTGAADTGLMCLLILARFYDLPADGSQLRHQFAQSGQLLSDTDLLRAAKHLAFNMLSAQVTGPLLRMVNLWQELQQVGAHLPTQPAGST